MKDFMDDDFLLSNDTAKELFSVVKNEPIIDFHNHLDPKEIYEDKCFCNMTDVWLKKDHYKWRAMRANGVPEKLITGDSEDFDKFLEWADTVENLIGNPLYHWTHLELQRYFGISTPLKKDTAEEIFNICNEKLKDKSFSVRNLLRMQRVSVLCTTDDPADSLEWHRKIKDDGFEIKVLPSFRPEKAMGIEKEGFTDYLKRLEDASKIKIEDIDSLIGSLLDRLEFFSENGCRVSDHSLEGAFFIKTDHDEANNILKKRLKGEKLSLEETGKFKGYLLSRLGRAYFRSGIVMQLHIGALRNNSKRFYDLLGPDAGFDSINDFKYAANLSALLNSMDETGELPKTILYCLNPNDMEMLSSLAGNFSANDEGIKGYVQLGAAWWFSDHKNGIERQLDAVSDMGLLSASVGMLTDSRSFLSFPRHELYRRILCNKIGTWVENGEYPKDVSYLNRLVKNICGENAKKYFGFL